MVVVGAMVWEWSLRVTERSVSANTGYLVNTHTSGCHRPPSIVLGFSQWKLGFRKL